MLQRALEKAKKNEENIKDTNKTTPNAKKVPSAKTAPSTKMNSSKTSKKHDYVPRIASDGSKIQIDKNGQKCLKGTHEYQGKCILNNTNCKKYDPTKKIVVNVIFGFGNQLMQYKEIIATINGGCGS